MGPGDRVVFPPDKIGPVGRQRASPGALVWTSWFLNACSSFRWPAAPAGGSRAGQPPVSGRTPPFSRSPAYLGRAWTAINRHAGRPVRRLYRPHSYLALVDHRHDPERAQGPPDAVQRLSGRVRRRRRRRAGSWANALARRERRRRGRARGRGWPARSRGAPSARRLAPRRLAVAPAGLGGLTGGLSPLLGVRLAAPFRAVSRCASRLLDVAALRVCSLRLRRASPVSVTVSRPVGAAFCARPLEHLPRLLLPHLGQRPAAVSGLAQPGLDPGQLLAKPRGAPL